MASDEEIGSLKHAYEVWQSLDIAYEYGPLRAYSPADHGRVQDMWRDIVNPAVGLVDQTQIRRDDGSYVTQAPSPWHAYFYLRAQQQFAYRSGRPLGTPMEEAGSALGEHLFFRGQRCSTWAFQSSLSRKSVQERKVEELAVVALTEYFRAFFVANEDVASNTGRCFAQHYGVATDLADISCEPDVAIWFATHPFGAACPGGETRGVVQAVSWAGQKHGTEAVCLLAPPFLRNVYEQRGLFLDTSQTKGVLAGKITLRVEFPRDTSAGEFRVRRRNHELAVWPAPDAVERELVDWAREVAAQSRNSDEVRHKVAEARAGDSLPLFWLERDLWDFDKHVSEWLGMLDWVLPATCVTAIPVSGAAEPMRFEMVETKARELVRANPSFFRALVGASEDAEFAGFEALHAVLKVAKHELDL